MDDNAPILDETKILTVNKRKSAYEGGLSIFKINFFGRCIVRYSVEKHALRLHSHVTVNLNFRPYI